VKYLNPFRYFLFLKRKIVESRKRYQFFSYKRKLNKVKNVDELINLHFNFYSSFKHINYGMFKFLFSNFDNKPLKILETGSSAYGIKSSYLFLNYVKKFGGKFTTVDLNPDIRNEFLSYLNENIEFVVSDSVEYLSSMNKTDIKELDVVYLDSYDVDLNNPEPSENHGYNEFRSIEKYLKSGCLIAIDDTPKDYSMFSNLTESSTKIYKERRKQFGNNYTPGKGAKIILNLEIFDDFKIIYHEYSLVLQKV
tara:strand:+ start:461 stop:1213 length:753 start_codon:yes stop_codon:yes gene_type:complete